MMRTAVNIVLLAFLVGGLYSCLSLKSNELYTDDSPPDTTFYKAEVIFADQMKGEVWTSTAECLSMEAIPEAAYKGTQGLHVKWDRITEGCPWQGVGFGWDDWNGKDLSLIKNEAAIEFYVKMPKGERASLPWAFALEDFTGAQAWLGLNPNTLIGDNISDSKWTQVLLPLSEFNWAEQGADFNNIKQAIIQLDAEGEMYIDEIRIVPYKGGFRKRANIVSFSNPQFLVDGETTDPLWSTQGEFFGNNEVHLAFEGQFLCIGLRTTDPDPLSNSYTADGSKCYEGDGLEILFGTEADAAAGRLRLRSTDQHLTFALGREVSLWDNRKKKFLKEYQSAVKKVPNGYVFEARIDLGMLTEHHMLMNKLYALEIAVNHGNAKERVRQDRWNTPNKGGYYENPSIWGELLIKAQTDFPDNP